MLSRSALRYIGLFDGCSSLLVDDVQMTISVKWCAQPLASRSGITIIRALSLLHLRVHVWNCLVWSLCGISCSQGATTRHIMRPGSAPEHSRISRLLIGLGKSPASCRACSATWREAMNASLGTSMGGTRILALISCLD